MAGVLVCCEKIADCCLFPQFQENEKRRYEAETKRGEPKHKRQLEELQAATEAHAKELEQMQNEKREQTRPHEAELNYTPHCEA